MASGTGNYLYNAEHQMTSADVGGVTTTYSYDGDGKRVEKSGGKIYWYGGDSDALIETDLSGDTNNATFSEYVFFGGKRISRRDYQNNIFFYFADHLGTSREMLQASQTSACYDADFYPYGGEITHTNTCTQNYKFTSKERDTESGLDNFGARYNSSSLGRFISPDPKLMSLRRAVNPQEWNMYAYTGNNPIVYVDPNGRELHLVIYNSSGLSEQTATRVAIGIAAKYEKAGVKNVSFEVKKGTPGALTEARYEMLPTPHSHLLEIRPTGQGSPNIPQGEGGHNWDLGGHSALDVSAVNAKGPKSDDDLVTGLINVGSHESGHDVLGHQGGSNDIMNGEGEADPNWLFNPNLQFSPDEAKALQDKYNSAGEIELTPPTPPPPPPPPCVADKDHPCS